ncbi:unnamed protein product [Lactuca saligna]|uniref:Uncharacterized protein n=1 Tax=Lactuca saligna TaxID=75948 RepID=A0AA35ZLQ4_LACSI|nr:unnamed protein product [Lactuca saligna]
MFLGHILESKSSVSLWKAVVVAVFLAERFTARLVSSILSRVLKASVGFRISGWRCLRDVRIKFERGAVESVSIGEIKLSLRKSLVKLGGAFISRDPKLLFVISEIEVVTRTAEKTSKTTKSRRPKTSSGSSKPGKKLKVIANVARFFSLSVRDLVVKTPKASLEIKDVGLDLSKDPGSKPSVYLKLQMLPIVIHLGDNISCSKGSESLCAGDGSTMHKSSAHFICEEFGLLFEFGPHSILLSSFYYSIVLGKICPIIEIQNNHH